MLRVRDASFYLKKEQPRGSWRGSVGSQRAQWWVPIAGCCAIAFLYVLSCCIIIHGDAHLWCVRICSHVWWKNVSRKHGALRMKVKPQSDELVLKFNAQVCIDELAAAWCSWSVIVCADPYWIKAACWSRGESVCFNLISAPNWWEMRNYTNRCVI